MSNRNRGRPPMIGPKNLTSLNEKQVKQVKRIINYGRELKAIDTNILQSIDASGTITKLNHPPQGINVSQRLGDAILLKRVRLRLNMIYGDNTNVLRCIVFRWTQDNSIAANVPIVTDVLQTLNATAFYNFTHERANQVHIVYDKTIALSANGVPDKVLVQNFFGKKLGKKTIDMDAAVTTGTDQLYLLLISDSVAAPHPTVGGFLRMEYTDA